MDEASKTAAQAARPLAGITVLDFTRFMPGPLASQQLGDLGAEVIKVEGFPYGDLVRGMEPAIGFTALNRGKRSLFVDFQSAGGRQILERLIARADVFIEVSRPGGMAALKLDYEAVRALRPDVVYCSVSAFGQFGPDRDTPSHGMNLDALAGMLPVQTGPDGSPRVAPDHPYLTSLLAAQGAATGICAALVRRALTGEGCYIDASCWDVALSGDAVASAAALNDAPLIDGLGSRATPKYAPYVTADGRLLMVCALEDKFWRGFCQRIGRPDLIEAFDRAGQAADDHTGIWGQREAWVYDEVAPVIAAKTLAEWEAIFAGSELPVTAIRTRKEALSGPHAAARGLVVEGRDTAGRAFKLTAPGLMFDGERAATTRMAPALGEHTDELLAWLGYSPDEVRALRDDKAIG